MRFRFLLVMLLVFSAGAAHAQTGMSESERKATARVAFTDGLKLQEDGKPSEALAKFETAQNYFDAPTHLLHIAECQALTGKLVEAAETYEILTHRMLGGGASEAFVEAQEHGKIELSSVRARIPTMKVTTKPDAKDLKSLEVVVNGTALGSDLVGLARPVNPGAYKINAAATGYKLERVIEVTILEKDNRVVELSLVPGARTGAVVAPLPPTYVAGATSTAPSDGTPPPPKPNGPSSFGLLLGLNGEVLVPAGGVTTSLAPNGSETGHNFSDVAAAGGQLGFDAMLRVAKMLLLGLTLDFAGLTGPSSLDAQTAKGVEVSVKSRTTFFGVTLGILPNVDKLSFYGNLGVGIRTFDRTLTIGGTRSDESLGGPEGLLEVGLSIPIGPIRLIPKFGVTAGAFGSVNSDCAAVLSSSFKGCLGGSGGNTSTTHELFFVGFGGLYSIDLSKN